MPFVGGLDPQPGREELHDAPPISAPAALARAARSNGPALSKNRASASNYLSRWGRTSGILKLGAFLSICARTKFVMSKKSAVTNTALLRSTSVKLCFFVTSTSALFNSF